MNQEVAQKWSQALRSGKYKEGTHQSEHHRHYHQKHSNEDTYSVLGVLCKLALKEGVDVAPTFNHTDTGLYTYYDGEIGFLPKSVQEWAGLESGLAGYEDDLGDLKDLLSFHYYGATFEELAGAIDSLWERL